MNAPNSAGKDADFETHFRAAEKLLKPITRYYNGGQTVRDEGPSELDVARAQAHATLALAAATRVTPPAAGDTP